MTTRRGALRFRSLRDLDLLDLVTGRDDLARYREWVSGVPQRNNPILHLCEVEVIRNGVVSPGRSEEFDVHVPISIGQCQVLTCAWRAVTA
jgi:hypothetical protein